MFAPPPSTPQQQQAKTNSIKESDLKPKGASSLDDMIREGRENRAAADAEVEANGGFFSTVFKRQGFLGGTEPSAPPAATPAAPSPRAASPAAKSGGGGGGGAVACSKGEERCVDSRVASGQLSPWRSGRGGASKDQPATARDLRRASKALALRVVSERETPAGPLVTAESAEGDLFEFLAGSTQVDYRVRAARASLFGSDGGSVARAEETLQRMRDLLFRQFGWGSV